MKALVQDYQRKRALQLEAVDKALGKRVEWVGSTSESWDSRVTS